MRQHLAKLTLVLLGGCSLIYNPNNIEKPPADASDAQTEMLAIDARIDAPALADANPAALTVLDASPSVIFEGQGVDNSAQAMLVIAGHHFIPGATVQIAPATDLNVGTPTVSTNGDFIAVPITAAINAGVNTGTVALTITVNESGATPQNLTGKLSLTYLPQLTGTTLTLPLAERYSQVALGNTTPTFAGTAGNVIIRSVSSIKCGTAGNVALDLKGKTASGTSAGAAGSGGCAGGAAGAAGGCSNVQGGGGAGGAGGGGGGGGYGTAGAIGGGGAAGGAIGVGHGSPLILVYTGTANDGSDRNQASGGGGGTASVGATSTGGGGGGGGGTIELTAGGDIACGAVDASGGGGGNAGSLVGSAGGGGGGAGGVIVMRTAKGSITNVTLAANGGASGSGASGGAGGTGGVGRIRVDAPGTLPTTAPTGVLHRGLAFASATMSIYTVDNPMVTLLGTAGDVFDMYVIDSAGVEHTGEPQNQTIDTSGMKTMQVTLLAGYNRLCATLRPGTRDKNDPYSLADKCIEVAYLP